MPKEDYRHKIITDPVHGDIGLSKLETKLINTKIFQRLRHINQLGLTSLVYPNASHSRFVHSLGVFHIMSRSIKMFQERGVIKANAARIMRIAALLHDIGHYPYSHLIESIDAEVSRRTLIVPKGNGEKESNPLPAAKYAKHEKLSSLIVKENKEIKKFLKDERHIIAAIIKGEQVEDILVNLPKLLKSTLDVDRMDYLARDSLNTGVPYGQADINYILNNLELTGEFELVINPKAKAAVEHFVIGRYFMYKNVYQHHTTVAFEGLLRNILYIFRHEGIIYPPEEIEGMIFENNPKFFDFHDGYIEALIKRYAKPSTRLNSYKELPVLCRALRHRIPPKMIKEVAILRILRDDEHTRPRKEVDNQFFGRSTEAIIKFLCEEFGISRQQVFFEIQPITFEALGPTIPLSQIGDIDKDEKRDLVNVRESDGSIHPLVEYEDSILKVLSQYKHETRRLFVVDIDNKKRDTIRKKLSDWLVSS